MKDIREAAAARLASGERTGKELLDYLAKKGYDRSEAREVVEEFRELGYIDEERYASLFMSYAAGKGWGSGRIKAELAKRGVDPSLIGEALEEALEAGSLENDSERALSVARKMTDPGTVPDEKAKARIARRLAGYGYGTSVIYDTLRKLEQM